MQLIGKGDKLRVGGRNEYMRLLLQKPKEPAKVPLLKRLLALVVRP